MELKFYMQIHEFTQQLTQPQSNNLTIILNQENNKEIIPILEKNIKNLKIIDLGKLLPKVILDDTPSISIEEVLSNFMCNEKSDFFLITNSGILFDVSLSLNPLGLFKKLSIKRKLIVLWYGKKNNNQLTYARQGHLEYDNGKYIISTIDAWVTDLDDALP
jgi:hypothetical protein